MRCVDRLLGDADLKGYTPTAIRAQLIAYIRQNGGTVVEQVPETRENWRDRYLYYYKVVLPLAGFKHGLFVEMRLTDFDDPEFPVVVLVNAHPQMKNY
jgi:hypothetical protein